MEEILNEREIRVLKYMCEGYSNREIVDIMFISPNTAKVYVSGILRKFGAENRTTAAYMAGQKDLIEQNSTENAKKINHK